MIDRGWGGGGGGERRVGEKKERGAEEEKGGGRERIGRGGLPECANSIRGWHLIAQRPIYWKSMGEWELAATQRAQWQQPCRAF